MRPRRNIPLGRIRSCRSYWLLQNRNVDGVFSHPLVGDLLQGTLGLQLVNGSRDGRGKLGVLRKEEGQRVGLGVGNLADESSG